MKSKKPAVFLDRDGTINVDYGYVCQKERLQFADGALKGLKILQDAGYLLVIITNQSGVARGYFSLEELEKFHSYMLEQLRLEGIFISGLYYCPHLNGCDCRKPGLELFYQAQKELQIDFSRSYAIGDQLRDLSICSAEPVRGYLIDCDITKCPEGKNIKQCRNLLQAAECIVEKGNI